MVKRRKPVVVLLLVAFVVSLMLPGVTSATPNLNSLKTSGIAQKLARDEANTNSANQKKFVEGEIILRLKGSSKAKAQFLKDQQLTLVKQDGKVNYLLAKTAKSTDINKLAAKLRKNHIVELAQPNYVYQTFGRPNDPLYYRQWQLNKTNAEQAWNVTKGKPAVTIAVLDTGVDVNHPDLKNNIVPGTNTVNPLKSVRDDDGHGTHVAGIIAATANNGLGVSGVASNCKIMPVKVFDYWGGSDVSVADGLIWAADHGAKVVNMSFGSGYKSSLLGEAIEYAKKKGVVMVAAAGNWASEEISYPAALSDVIAVSATDENDKLASFSSYGPEIDICAPGDKVFSTFWDSHKGSSYCDMSGTSMASPMVAGLAGLLLSNNPKLNDESVRQIIESSAKDLGDKGWDPKYGHGRIDIYKALTTSFAKIDANNNSQKTAVRLNSGQVASQKIDYGADEDWYTISVPDKASLAIELQPAGKVTPGLEIYDSEGEKIESFNVLESDEKDEPSEGDYYLGDYSWGVPSIKVGEAVYAILNDLSKGDYSVRVFGNHNRWSDDNYKITLETIEADKILKDDWEMNDEEEMAKKITLGTKIQGVLNPSGDEDWYRINLMPNTTYEIRTEVPAGLDLALSVNREEEIGSMSDEEDWDYSDYMSQDIDYGKQGVNEVGTIRTGDKGGWYLIQVYEPGNGAVNAYYTLTVNGFTPPVDSYESNDTMEEAKKINFDTKISGSFADAEDEDWFEIDSTKKGIVEIQWNADPSLNPVMELYNEDGEPVSYVDLGSELLAMAGLSNGDSEAPKEMKIVPGKFYLRLANYWGADSGNYSFTLKVKEFNFIDNEINDGLTTAEQFNLGETRQGTLYPIFDQDVYAIDVPDKTFILVQVTPAKGVDTIISVARETVEEDSGEDEAPPKDGSDYGEGDAGYDYPNVEYITDINTGKEGQTDSGVVIASKPGTYYFCVYGWSDLLGKPSTEPYKITIKKFNATPDAFENNNTMKLAKPIAANGSVSPTFMNTEDVDWFKFSVASPSYLTVNLDVPNDIDGVVELYDSAGKFMGKVDVALEGDKEIANFTLSKKGTYYIKAYDYLGNASPMSYKLTTKTTAITKR